MRPARWGRGAGRGLRGTKRFPEGSVMETPWAGRFLRRAGLWLARVVYRVRLLPSAPLPEGPCLLLPNHLTWVDAVLVQAVSPRPIRYLVEETYYRNRFLGPVLRILGALPVSSSRAKEALRAAVAALRRGETVCLFPEGRISRTGSLLRLQRGYTFLARESGVPVVPVWLDGTWGSVFSFSEGRYFFKKIRRLPYPVSVVFGEAIPAVEAAVGVLRERLLDLSEQAFQARPGLRGHLGRAALAGLVKRAGAEALVDGMDGSTLSRGMLAAAALHGSIDGLGVPRNLRGSAVRVLLRRHLDSLNPSIVAELARTTHLRSPRALLLGHVTNLAILTLDLDILLGQTTHRVVRGAVHHLNTAANSSTEMQVRHD